MHTILFHAHLGYIYPAGIGLELTAVQAQRLTVGLQRVFGEARVPLLSTSDSREQMRRPGLCFAVCWWLVLSARPVPAASPEGSW